MHNSYVLNSKNIIYPTENTAVISVIGYGISIKRCAMNYQKILINTSEFL
jgi:hypothetical protein